MPTEPLLQKTLPTDYLDEEKLIQTIAKLHIRIRERFPDSSLANMAQQLGVVANESANIANSISRPRYWWRALQGFGIIFMIALLLWQFSQISWQDGIAGSFSEFMQGSEALVSELFFLGTTIIFIMSLEQRSKRHKVIAAVNRLRSIAHVIDMHQLTKDPLFGNIGIARTKNSPERTLSGFLLARYLNYCVEMLALTSKIGFIYIQEFPNAECVTLVNDLEVLCNNIALKIWQKLLLLEQSSKNR